MEKNENVEVLTAEIVDDSKEISKAVATKEIDVKMKEVSMEKTGKWINTIALIGSGILKLISTFSKNTPNSTFSKSGNNDPSPGKRRRKHGRHS